jgi:putative NADPH-quinone reductase
MGKRITVIVGHPDASPERFCHALAQAYAQAAQAGGHEVRRIALGGIDVPILRTAHDWANGSPTPAIREAQETIAWAGHLVIIYPLWLGAMPALLKAFFEQVFRPGFAIEREHRKLWPGLLKGKSARIVVTMGMPGWFYRVFFRAHSLKSLERNILKFAGIGPIRETLIGSVEADADKRQDWLGVMRDLGREGR